MVKEKDIINKLNNFGFKGAEIQKVLTDITYVCILKFIESSNFLTEAEKDTISSLKKEDMDIFFVNKIKSLNQKEQENVQEKFNLIYDSTWNEYFEFIKK